MTPVRAQWLGINAVRFEHAGHVTLLDPYVTRNPNAQSHRELVARYFPRADTIIVSHSHWDHAADVPAVALQTGATVVGSITTVSICRSYGVPDGQLVVVGPGDEYSDEQLSIRFLPSLHAVSSAGEVAYPGIYQTPPRPPLAREEYLEGGTFAPLLDFGRGAVLNVGSANFIDEALAGIACDLLLVSIARMENTPDFLPRLLGLVAARRIVAVHFDDFTRPLEQGLTVQPYVDIDSFTKQASALAPDAEVLVPDLFEVINLH